MKQVFFRISATLMFLLLTTSMFANSNKEASKTVESLDANYPGWEVDTSPITLDWYLHFSWFPRVWGDDETSRYITEKTGVSIDFIVPAGSEAEKLNTMIAGDQLPDIITLGWWEPQINDMIDGEMLYPLEELAEKYDPYFFKVASPARLGWYKNTDGHTYGYPNASYTIDDYKKYNIPSNNTFLVRKDMYEAIGSPDMRTPQGFLDALQAAKDMFPQVNNQPLIPFGMANFSDQGNLSLEVALQDHLAIPRQKNGKLYDRFSDPEYKRWMKTLRQANERDLISSDVFIDQRSQMEEKLAQGRYFAVLYQASDLRAQQFQLNANDPESIFIAVNGPANKNLDPPTLTGTGINGWTVTLISKNCKDPARAIRFLSYWMSEEGQHDFTLGAPGQWETVNGKDQMLPELNKLMNDDKAAYETEYGGNQTYWMLMDNPMFKQWEPAVISPLKELEEWTYPYASSYSQFDIVPPGHLDEGVTYNEQRLLRGKYFPLLIIAESDEEFDAVWDEWQAKKVDIGVPQMMEWMQPVYEENCKKLGVPVK